jgi:L-alanine-DL-glutamate epimerase-like enolase superfamily enzyme
MPDFMMESDSILSKILGQFPAVEAESTKGQHRIAALSAKHVKMPLKEPFETAKRRASVSDTVFVELITENGTTGLGAATPVKYVTRETIESVISAVNEAERAICSQDVRAFPRLALRLKDVLPDSPGARAAVETAIIDACGKIAGKPSYELFGGTSRTIETDITIPIVPPDHAGELAAENKSRGFRLFKVKVGSGNEEEDLARTEAISRAVPGCRLVVDANQGFSPDKAVNFISRLMGAGVNVAIFEQPVERHDLEGLAYVTRSVSVPVFADESACSVEDVLKLAEQKCVSGVNIKLMKSGIYGAMEMIAGCRANGLGSMLGCMIEPRVGITAAIHLACIFEDMCHFDLDADLLLDEEGSGGFIREGAFISPVKAPGLGCLSV